MGLDLSVEDVSGFVEAFSGGHRDVLDYLAEEVLHRQPEDVRSSLLETYVPDRGVAASLLPGVTDRFPQNGGDGQ